MTQYGLLTSSVSRLVQVWPVHHTLSEVASWCISFMVDPTGAPWAIVGSTAQAHAVTPTQLWLHRLAGPEGSPVKLPAWHVERDAAAQIQLHRSTSACRCNTGVLAGRGSREGALLWCLTQPDTHRLFQSLCWSFDHQQPCMCVESRATDDL